jgi:hypothetical protein
VTSAVLVTGVDRRFAAWAVAWSVASLLAFGLVAAIIPNPLFARQIPVEPFAIAVWLLSAPLMGLIAATYMVAPTATPAVAAPLIDAVPMMAAPPPLSNEPRSTTLGTIAGVGAFLAIGCPVCNKIALLLLGSSGALTVFAPLQPVIGAASLVLLAATLTWRMRMRAGGAVCVRPGA